ncbi:MAG: hypothetical protein KJO98_01805 [Rhodothermia bacterium]|nr:hypothetical protein [Rhodothermia bacterium]
MRLPFYAALPAMMILAIAGCQPPQSAHPLVGTWEQLRSQAFLADTTLVWNIADRSPEYRPLKIVSETHFAYLHPSDSGDSLLHAGKGRVEVNTHDSTYTEHIHFHAVEGLKGTSLRFKFELDEGLWYHIRDDTPIWDAARDMNGGRETYRSVEIWERK